MGKQVFQGLTSDPLAFHSAGRGGGDAWIRLVTAFLLRVEWWLSELGLQIHLEPEALIVNLRMLPTPSTPCSHAGTPKHTSPHFGRTILKAEGHLG